MAAKVFEVGDVLPATTQLRISWISDILNLTPNKAIYTEEYFRLVYIDTFGGLYINNLDITIYDADIMTWYPPYTNYNGDHAYCDIDTSTWDINKRTISSISTGFDIDIFRWEDLNAPSGYTITFNSNGGSSVTSISDATELPTPLPTPTKSGYTFVAWYYESNFQTRAKAGDTIESNVTLYAKWHNLGSLFTEIADAIRSKDGTSENIRDVDFGERIKQIQGAIELTQAQYDALGTKDANTYYLIVEVE
jgi:uncharacterized repeat protein (TIGR02543 family)